MRPAPAPRLRRVRVCGSRFDERAHNIRRTRARLTFPMSRPWLSCAALAAALLCGASPLQPPLEETADVLVYGGTASGLAAGIAAANGVGSRHSVRVLEPLLMLGGMAVAGGVGLMNNEAGVYGQGLGGRFGARSTARRTATRPSPTASPK